MTFSEDYPSVVSVDLHPGLMVSGSVRLVRQIGEGGMASVWLADHLALETQVAVKFMSPALACYPAAVERFTREAKAAARIRHANVVQIFDCAAPPGMPPYIVMELLEGEDLERRLDKGGRLTLDEAAEVIFQAGRALEKAHEMGIVHRDIKAENIFVSGVGRDLTIKVLDFGIAKDVGSKGKIRVTNTGATLGTPSYMSPEQMLSAKNVDYRCDLWALAVVAYYAVVGKLPFEGETYGAICLAVNHGRFAMPSRLRPNIPPALDDWFAQALNRDSRKRFYSAREMGEAFVAALDAVPAGRRRTITPFTTVSARGTLMSSAFTDAGEPERRSSVPMVASLALVAGATMAVLFGRPLLLERPVVAHVAFAASSVAPATGASLPSADAPPMEERTILLPAARGAMLTLAAPAECSISHLEARVTSPSPRIFQPVFLPREQSIAPEEPPVTIPKDPAPEVAPASPGDG